MNEEALTVEAPEESAPGAERTATERTPPPAAPDGTPEPERAQEPSPPPPRQEGPDYRAHLAALYAQGAALERELPDFSLREALQDPDFVRLTSPAVGVSVRRAWYALHGPERERQAARRAGEAAAESIARSSARPREGGRGLSDGTLSAPDYRALDRQSRAALRQRVYDAAARGEKVYP